MTDRPRMTGTPGYRPYGTPPTAAEWPDGGCQGCVHLMNELAALTRTHNRCLDLQLALARLLEAAEEHNRRIQEEQSRRPRQTWCACQPATTIGDSR